MMRTRSIQMLLLCAAASLSACNGDSSSATPSNAATQVKAKTPAVVKTGPTPGEQTIGMVEAVSQGKSQAPIELKFDLGARPKVGQPLQIDLALIAQIPGNPATIQVNGAEGITVDAGANQFDIPAAEAGEVYKKTASVTPNAEGVLLVGVTVSLKHDEITDSKAFSIPIIAER
jgi:hypothetical protein